MVFGRRRKLGALAGKSRHFVFELDGSLALALLLYSSVLDRESSSAHPFFRGHPFVRLGFFFYSWLRGVGRALGAWGVGGALCVCSEGGALGGWRQLG